MPIEKDVYGSVLKINYILILSKKINMLADGYNVIFSWDKLKETAADNIDGARTALINILCNYQGYKRCV